MIIVLPFVNLNWQEKKHSCGGLISTGILTTSRLKNSSLGSFYTTGGKSVMQYQGGNVSSHS